MPALLTDLINQVSDPTVKTSDLLRKALVVARRLKQPEWVTWIGYELQGYPDEVELPPYRVLYGELKVDVPGHGRLPLPIRDPEMSLYFSECRVGYRMGELEGLAVPGKVVRSFFSSEKAAFLMREFQLPGQPEVALGSNQVQGLIDAVRDKLHAWALDLEGDEMPSPPQAPVTILIDGGFHGGQLMVSSPGGQQQQTVTGEQKAADPSGLAQGSVDAPRQPAERDRRQSEPDTLTTAKRKWPLFVVLAGGSALAVLQSAGGGVLSELVLKWLATLSGG
ncbi:hypothetical protein [Aeromonas hydrophila]|uniref:AbiTii domain-containing protein n=1 Tax=Aeromonas hydrophila TaxID=644 RepID=UPI0030159051